MERLTISKLEKQTIYEIYRACRICGAGGGYRMPIIQNIVALDTSDVELVQKIQECLQLEVRSDDRMPPLICELCVDKVNDYYEFLKQSRQTNIRTRTRLGLPLQTVKKSEILNLHIPNSTDSQLDRFPIQQISNSADSQIYRFLTQPIPNSLTSKLNKFPTKQLLNSTNSQLSRFPTQQILNSIESQFNKFPTRQILNSIILNSIESQFKKFPTLQILNSIESQFNKFPTRQILNSIESQFKKFPTRQILNSIEEDPKSRTAPKEDPKSRLALRDPKSLQGAKEDPKSRQAPKEDPKIPVPLKILKSKSKLNVVSTPPKPSVQPLRQVVRDHGRGGDAPPLPPRRHVPVPLPPLLRRL
ncbi:hypothetical protein MSG28_015930 [Choristoneura fumiferana]|uniref:Uncharacterized protein n=1 Tax=Choristoneura fumiferana TaxID=7141 RepID=A0ACC0K584_CHOFU|nr:hypothetical protein MSG28_015930 [Choristoneura fumiferana]